MFKAPNWQTSAIKDYFSNVDPSTLPDNDPNVTYVKGGRGTPDVCALGTGYPIITGGKLTPGVGGTSASAPVFAAIVSVLNTKLATAGQKPMGVHTVS